MSSTEGIKEAAFIVGFLDDRDWTVAATTRLDRAGSIGLPGGKVEIGETPYEAAIRESFEEGWDFRGCDILKKPVYETVLSGYRVYWFVCLGGRPVKLSEYKEKHRNIVPIEAHYRELTDYGNDVAVPLALEVYKEAVGVLDERFWNVRGLWKQLKSYGFVGEKLGDLRGGHLGVMLQEAARRSSKRIMKLMQKYDVAFLTAFRSFKNLPPLPGEEVLRKDVKDLNDREVEVLARSIRERYPQFDEMPKNDQEKLLRDEQTRRIRLVALERNRKRNEELLKQIRSSPAQYSYIPVRGAYHEEINGVPTQVFEESFLVVDHHGAGTLRDSAIIWGVQFDQDAIIFARAGKEPELIHTGKPTDKYKIGDIRDRFQAILYDDPSVYSDPSKSWTQLAGKRNLQFIQVEDIQNKERYPVFYEETKRKVFEKFFNKGPLNSEPYEFPKQVTEEESMKLRIRNLKGCLERIERLAEEYERNPSDEVYRKMLSQVKLARHTARDIVGYDDVVQDIVRMCESYVQKFCDVLSEKKKELGFLTDFDVQQEFPIGKIFVRSSGYKPHNYDFFKVIEHTGDKTVVVVPIAGIEVDDGKKVPDPDTFIGKPFKARAKVANDEHRTKILRFNLGGGPNYTDAVEMKNDEGNVDLVEYREE